MADFSTSSPFRCGLLALVVALLLGSPSVATAQQRPSYSTSSRNELTPKQKTILEIEILTPRTGFGLQGQSWRSLFAELDVPVRLRSGRQFEKIEIKERARGRLRHITVIGQINESGKLVFEGRTFTRTQTRELKEWIRELQTYGSQGTPEGKPLWGLNKSQFVSIYNALARVNLNDLSGLTFSQAVRKLDLPNEYPLRVSTKAESHLLQLSKAPTQTVTSTEEEQAATLPPHNRTQNRLAGISKGSALAVICSEFGLGFRPRRTPEAAIELEVIPLSELPKVELTRKQSENSDIRQIWPIGWDLETIGSKAVPTLYQLLPLELDETPLLAALSAIEEKSQVPMLVDFGGSNARGFDLNTLTVSYSYRQSSWSQLLRAITVPHKMTRKIRLDEASNPFVWITPFTTTPR